MQDSNIIYQIVNYVAEKRGKEWWVEPTSEWGELTEEDARNKALGITGNSEVAAVEGVAKALGLEENDITKLLGPKKENGQYDKSGEIYSNSSISPEISSKIQEAMKNGDKNKITLDILSTIHDNWVRNNSNNFMGLNKGKPREKEYQFVPLELLSWKDVESDYVFLKSILEAAGIQIDLKELENQFNIQQQEYLIENGIFSHEDLVTHISELPQTYKALEGLETTAKALSQEEKTEIKSKREPKSNLITQESKDEQEPEEKVFINELLGRPSTVASMALQIENQIAIKSRTELAMDIIKSDNPLLKEMFYVETVEGKEGFGKDKCPELSTPISKKEVLLSLLIGKPYPTYFLEGVRNHAHDEYRNELRPMTEEEKVKYEANQAELKDKVGSISSDKIVTIELGYDKNGEKIPGTLEVPEKYLIEAGIESEKMIGKEERTVSTKEIAKADEKAGLLTRVVEGAKGIFNKIMGREEKTNEEGERND